MLNQQPIEVKNLSSDGSVEVHSIFYTIQGEGPFSGHAAVFVRLAGCNLQCPGCDTDYTSKRQRMGVQQIVTEVIALTINKPAHLVVITGGEPFRQNILPLIQQLSDLFYVVQVETNGTVEIPEQAAVWSTIVCSPKTSKLHRSNAERIDYFKYVLSHDSVNPSDGLPILALNHSNSGEVARPYPGFDKKRIYIQPMDSKVDSVNALNTRAAVESCMQHGYTLQLQIHKFVGVE